MSMTLGHQPAAEHEPVADRTPTLPSGVSPGPKRLTRANVQTAFLIALPVLLLAYVCIAAVCVHDQVAVQRLATTRAVEDAPHPNGLALYAQHCARCHGTRGSADGPSSPFLDPPARRFGEDKFKLASTTNGIPTDDDLLYVIQHGIPGTSMPSFDHLSDAERRALVAHIRWLTQAGVYTKLYRRAKKDEDDPDVAELSMAAAKQVVQAPPLEVPADLPPPDAASLARGRETFAKNCATCHGPKGAGDGPQVKDMKDDNGRPNKPRDLARGIFKGGGEPQRLYVRIALGMPGTTMPNTLTALTPQQLGDLVNFVRSLSDPTVDQ
jgi:mono/diheme cytochrome c family protein